MISTVLPELRSVSLLVLLSSIVLLSFAAKAQANGANEQRDTLAKAVFAGGCFWCMEPPFEKIAGVSAVVSGYSGGTKENAEYKKVSAGRTKHAEVVQVQYDPTVVSYEELLEIFWRNIDPTAINRQFCDAGSQYRSAVFYRTKEEKALALQSKRAIEKNYGYTVHTEIVPFEAFYPAEEYHEDYYKKNPGRYYRYRQGCGRDQRLKELWEK